MNQPAAKTKAMALHEQCASSLHNLSKPLDILGAARLLKEFNRELDDADFTGKAQLFALIGIVKFRQGKFDEALKAYRNADMYRPNQPAFSNSIGASLMCLGDVREAIDVFEAMVSRFSLSGANALTCYSNLAEAYWRLEDPDKSRKNMLDAIRHTDLSDQSQLFQLALQHAIIGWNNDATELFARAIAVRADQPRGDGPAAELLTKLEPNWRESFAHVPELVASVERVIANDEAEAHSPELSTWGTTDPVATKALFDLPDSMARPVER